MTQILDTQSGQRALPTLAVDIAWTIAAVAVLVVLGKGIAALGEALSLPNACWQLLALRAAAGAAVIGALVSAGRGSLVLFGLLYAVTLMWSHSSPVLFVSVAIAGVLAAGIWRSFSASKYSLIKIYTISCVFVLTLSGGSLYNKLRRGEGWVGLGEWGWDAMIRLSGAVAVLTLGVLVLRLFANRPQART